MPLCTMNSAIPYVFKIVLYLFERLNYREGEAEVSHLLVHSPNKYNDSD